MESCDITMRVMADGYAYTLCRTHYAVLSTVDADYDGWLDMYALLAPVREHQRLNNACEHVNKISFFTSVTKITEESWWCPVCGETQSVM